MMSMNTNRITNRKIKETDVTTRGLEISEESKKVIEKLKMFHTRRKQYGKRRTPLTTLQNGRLVICEGKRRGRIEKRITTEYDVVKIEGKIEVRPAGKMSVIIEKNPSRGPSDKPMIIENDGTNIDNQKGRSKRDRIKKEQKTRIDHILISKDT
jgi:hypothetical protein